MDGHLRNNLQKLSLDHYIDVLQRNGFVDWASLSKIREEDFDRLSFKLGHRRRLQRELACMTGLPYWQPICRQHCTCGSSCQLDQLQPWDPFSNLDRGTAQKKPVRIQARHWPTPKPNDERSARGWKSQTVMSGLQRHYMTRHRRDSSQVLVSKLDAQPSITVCPIDKVNHCRTRPGIVEKHTNEPRTLQRLS